jgi:hypothetical protein
MDPVTIIVGAVVAGASAGVTDLVKDELTTAYRALRERLRARFGKGQLLDNAVDELERNPESTDSREVMELLLRKAGVDKDDELVALAEQVTRTAGLDVRQVQKLAEGARAIRAGMIVEGLQPGEAKIDQRQILGKDAVAEDSPVRIVFGPAAPPPAGPDDEHD